MSHPSEQLLGGMSVDLFNREVRELKHWKFASALPDDVLRPLFDLPAFERLLLKEAIPPHFVDVVERGVPKRLSDLSRSDGTLKAVIAALKRGCTIRVSDVQRFHEPLHELIQGTQRLFAARSQVNAYLTPADHSGFQPHFDTTDVFIVQCMGDKEWTIFEDYEHRLDLPLVDTPWLPEEYAPGQVADTLLLGQGDVLYIPRGVMHCARCLAEPSLHLTVSVWPLTIADILAQEVRRLALSDPTLRKRVPIEVDGDALAKVTDMIDDAIRGVLERIDVASALATANTAIANAVSPTRPGDLEGALRNRKSHR